LDHARFAEAFSLIIPLGDADAPTRQATEELRRARRALDEGLYENSISSARKVIEQLRRSPDGSLASPIRALNAPSQIVSTQRPTRCTTCAAPPSMPTKTR
jgi:hypothetical protein